VNFPSAGALARAGSDRTDSVGSSIGRCSEGSDDRGARQYHLHRLATCRARGWGAKAALELHLRGNSAGVLRFPFDPYEAASGKTRKGGGNSSGPPRCSSNCSRKDIAQFMGGI
jgi:hypothetical protein